MWRVTKRIFLHRNIIYLNDADIACQRHHHASINTILRKLNFFLLVKLINNVSLHKNAKSRLLESNQFKLSALISTNFGLYWFCPTCKKHTHWSRPTHNYYGCVSYWFRPTILILTNYKRRRERGRPFSWKLLKISLVRLVIIQ